MSFDFPLILLSLTLFSGVIALVDSIWRRFSGVKYTKGCQKHWIIDYARSFFPVFLIVLLIRSFVVQPYRVPTGSLEPTIMPGDFILVNQYEYGLKLPVWGTKIVKLSEPKRGQIALFHFPVNHRITFVKRVVGVPGDRISYIDKVFYINGKKQSQKFVGWATDRVGAGAPFRVKVYQENLGGVKHKIYIEPNRPATNFYNLKVPKGEYFMVGDNRDNSDDSRYWGFVKQKDFIGKALFVWLSWDSYAKSWLHKIRWDRIGTGL
jgi:signal peptidase I